MVLLIVPISVRNELCNTDGIAVLVLSHSVALHVSISDRVLKPVDDIWWFHIFQVISADYATSTEFMIVV